MREGSDKPRWFRLANKLIVTAVLAVLAVAVFLQAADVRLSRDAELAIAILIIAGPAAFILLQRNGFEYGYVRLDYALSYTLVLIIVAVIFAVVGRTT